MTRETLKNIYDCINRIAQKRESVGIDCSKWFLTDAEFAEIKKDKRNIIL